MNKFKRGDAVLWNQGGGYSLVGKIVTESYDKSSYVIETCSGLSCARKEDLTMYEPHYKYQKPVVNLSYLIKKVIFSDMATIVIWVDGTKTIVRKQDGDVYDPEKAIAMCFMKKICQNNKWSMNDIFETWINEDSPKN